MEKSNMEIQVSFRAQVSAEDYAEVKKGFDKYGAEIISKELPELQNIRGFKVEQVGNHQ